MVRDALRVSYAGLTRRRLCHERHLPLAQPDGNADRLEGRRLRGEPLQSRSVSAALWSNRSTIYLPFLNLQRPHGWPGVARKADAEISPIPMTFFTEAPSQMGEDRGPIVVSPVAPRPNAAAPGFARCASVWATAPRTDPSESSENPIVAPVNPRAPGNHPRRGSQTVHRLRPSAHRGRSASVVPLPV